MPKVYASCFKSSTRFSPYSIISSITPFESIIDKCSSRYSPCQWLPDYYSYDTKGQLSGEGTYGKVLEAERKVDKEQIALKLFKKTKAEHIKREGIPRSILRDISLLKMLNHRNIVRMFDVAIAPFEKEKEPLVSPGFSSGTEGYVRRPTSAATPIEINRPVNICLVTEYCQHSLAGLNTCGFLTLDNSSRPVPVFVIKCILKQVISGLRFMHNNHISHRDIKPHNILVTKHGVVKIGDFGISRHIPPSQLKQPQYRFHRIDICFGNIQVLCGEDGHFRGVHAQPSDKRIQKMITDYCGASISSTKKPGSVTDKPSHPATGTSHTTDADASKIRSFLDIKGVLTNRICGLWYRPIECFLEDTNYDLKNDIWSVGIMLLELLIQSHESFFPGYISSDEAMVAFIFMLRGCPDKVTWAKGVDLLSNFIKKHPKFKFPDQFIPRQSTSFSSSSSSSSSSWDANKVLRNYVESRTTFELDDLCFDLLCSMLELNPEKRPSCDEILAHPWMSDATDNPSAIMSILPTFGGCHSSKAERITEAAHRTHRTKALSYISSSLKRRKEEGKLERPPIPPGFKEWMKENYPSEKRKK
ncbi:hypothetical protein ADUPG1_014123 [Aduncisulcus paluster]|uniref:Protein kinase domain-containing protein n=1 Tax=Aduncisulcus paluster TaxID=2918883 RepID=A0ABQ5KCM5_9EUKA|nr:hypothetical protein ADUPG1_014123 [Aduncisulcus paluster]